MSHAAELSRLAEAVRATHPEVAERLLELGDRDDDPAHRRFVPPRG